MGQRIRLPGDGLNPAAAAVTGHPLQKLQVPNTAITLLY